jgi:hypothetical protein
LEYALRLDSDIHALYNENVSQFIGFVRSKGAKIVICKTVETEAREQLTGAINRMVDQAAPRRARQIRGIAQKKCWGRLADLLTNATVLLLNNNVQPVKRFYESLLQDEGTRSRLEALRDRRRSRGNKRTGLMPEESDMKILSETPAVPRDGNILFLVSNDGHFCEFGQEIERAFGVKLLPVHDLSQFMIKHEQVE